MANIVEENERRLKELREKSDLRRLKAKAENSTPDSEPLTVEERIKLRNAGMVGRKFKKYPVESMSTEFVEEALIEKELGINYNNKTGMTIGNNNPTSVIPGKAVYQNILKSNLRTLIGEGSFDGIAAAFDDLTSVVEGKTGKTADAYDTLTSVALSADGSLNGLLTRYVVKGEKVSEDDKLAIYTGLLGKMLEKVGFTEGDLTSKKKVPAVYVKLRGGDVKLIDYFNAVSDVNPGKAFEALAKNAPGIDAVTLTGLLYENTTSKANDMLCVASLYAALKAIGSPLDKEDTVSQVYRKAKALYDLIK